MRRCLVPVVVVVLGTVSFLTAQTPESAELMLEAATKMELLDGDLDAAIAQYRRIVAAHAGERAVAAQALVRMGGAYEKLGRLEARDAYARVVSEFADQAEQARQARLRLAALAGPGDEATAASGPTIRRVWDGPGEFPYFGRVSSDGRYYAHAVWSGNGGGNLAVRDLETGETRVLTTNEGPLGFPYSAVISPDNRQVAYAWWDRPGPLDLRMIAMDGSGQRVLYENAELVYPEVFDWSPDGSTILAALQQRDGTAQLALLSPSDGSVRVLKSVGWRWPDNMSFSPDGRFIAYDLPPDSDARARDVFVLAADGSREATLVEHPANDHLPFWTPDGRGIVFASDRTGSDDMWRIDVVDGRPAGAPKLVQREFPYDPRGLSRAGDYYYLSSTSVRQTYVATLDPDAGALLDEPRSLSPGSVGRVGAFDWSPDGRFLAYTVRSRHSRNAGGEELIVRDLETGEEHDVMPDDLALVNNPKVSPDGQRILVFATTRRGRQGLYVVEDGTARRVGSVAARPLGWSSDGRLIYGYNFSPTGPRVFASPLDTGERTEVARLVADPRGTHLLVRDPETGAERTVFEARDGELAVQVSPPRSRRMDGSWRSWWPVQAPGTTLAACWSSKPRAAPPGSSPSRIWPRRRRCGPRTRAACWW